MDEQEWRDEIQLLTDKLYYAERARDGHYRNLQKALKRIEQLEKEIDYIHEMNQEQIYELTRHKYFDADEQHDG